MPVGLLEAEYTELDFIHASPAATLAGAAAACAQPLSTNRKRGKPRVKDVPIYTAGSRNVPLFSAVGCHGENGKYRELPSKRLVGATGIEPVTPPV